MTEIKDIEQLLKKSLPYRPNNAHKGTMGTLLNISGSYSMAGACILSSLAALRSGVGLLKVALPDSIYPIVASSVYEAVFIPLEQGLDGTVTAYSTDTLLKISEGTNAVLLGCGMKNTYDTKEFVKGFVSGCSVPMLIDADGINALCSNINILKNKKAPIVITPHIMEMSRLTGLDVQYISKNLVEVATNFARVYSLTVVLKGDSVIVTDGDRILIRSTGNSGMAKGGCGDVLSGITASLMAQGTPAFEAACSSVYIHRTAGDIAAKKYSKQAMLPSDMISCLSDVFLQLTDE